MDTHEKDLNFFLKNTQHHMALKLHYSTVKEISKYKRRLIVTKIYCSSIKRDLKFFTPHFVVKICYLMYLQH